MEKEFLVDSDHTAVLYMYRDSEVSKTFISIKMKFRTLEKCMTCSIMSLPNQVNASIMTLPKDLLTNIFSRVASCFVDNLFNVQQSCKYLREIGNDDYVLQHACIDIVPYLPLSFMERCINNGNVEAFLTRGFQLLTLSSEEFRGLEFLKLLAQKEHAESTYLFGILLLYIPSCFTLFLKYSLIDLELFRQDKLQPLCACIFVRVRVCAYACVSKIICLVL
ncbi:hypothetical protein Dsin_027858 [Dipteronia sinensis]|uniref:F-box domain-containing protein n=1 Tax=Dipteronia sinensis TaxID=43782 RepID=A0AAD9ZPR3_9ROSI|nr:hypothetical protein Dsin_027858 [Dipteronia sinensis]